MGDPRGVVPPFARRFYHRISKRLGASQITQSRSQGAAPYEEMLRLNALKQQKKHQKKNRVLLNCGNVHGHISFMKA